MLRYPLPPQKKTTRATYVSRADPRRFLGEGEYGAVQGLNKFGQLLLGKIIKIVATIRDVF